MRTEPQPSLISQPSQLSARQACAALFLAASVDPSIYVLEVLGTGGVAHSFSSAARHGMQWPLFRFTLA